MRDWSGNRIPMYRVTACASEATPRAPRGLCPPRCEGYQGPRTDDRRLRRLNVRADQINGALRGRQLTLNGRRQPLEALGWTMRRATRPMMSMCTRSPSKSATRKPCNYNTAGRRVASPPHALASAPRGACSFGAGAYLRLDVQIDHGELE